MARSLRNYPDVEKCLVKPVLKEHLRRITDIEVLVFPSPWKYHFFAHEIGLPHRYHRVLIYQSQVIGYLFSHYTREELHISKIAIHPMFQGFHLGDRLMDDCVVFCKKKRIEQISLEVRVDNGMAIRFYNRWGFHILYRRKKYYDDGTDAWVMIKEIMPWA